MNTPLISLKGIRRAYRAGDEEIEALKGVDLEIQEGEMVAIIGSSGSGKSTLMNILGCLDQATAGEYRIAGRAVSSLDSDELAAMRREHFGFIFQRYHLLPELNAVGNVEIPAIYAGMASASRRERAAALLARLGMAERTSHRPGQLSGGQQQRVSIARALMNGANVILADEPTGALDSHSGDDVLEILEELNAEGHTVILVTHDPKVASRAARVIEIADGEITADTVTRSLDRKADGQAEATARKRSPFRIGAALSEAFQMALVAMWAHKLRSFLTMLGIIIGIASVVSVVAIGQGSQAKVLENISSLGTNTLEIFAGKSFGDVRAGKITTLTVNDANALSGQPYAAAVTPTVSKSSTVRYGSTESNALVNGVGAQYFTAKALELSDGSLFGASAVRARSQDVVIDSNTSDTLFPDGEDPIGKVILVGNVPARVIGVVATRQTGFGSSGNLALYMPYTAVQTRFLGETTLRSVILQVDDSYEMDDAENAVTALLTQRHGTKDFYILNTDDIRETITSTASTLALLITAIAVISLVVGGIGVMNIMLVSVSERVSEIGVRMAVGARRSDILLQFLIEATIVCLIGGFLGIAAALGFGTLLTTLSSGFSVLYSPGSIIAAVVCSTLIGLTFGYLPARSASKLDPVTALSGE
ncbi:MacB family efflux pump subunit [Martelella endophytica]|uniref:Pyoverdine export ATP-binding/permease protein PvdT n=1 Tax=Martelella endophytica TaxID=1486262 RepID=A0A0D5LSG7_MAREN|nr:MacB family efflux pump subunit [Martelella endophytica]AJY46875.1 macrolide transporter [Martelella endophytica]